MGGHDAVKQQPCVAVLRRRFDRHYMTVVTAIMWLSTESNSSERLYLLLWWGAAAPAGTEACLDRFRT